MNTRNHVLDNQLRWANAQGFSPDARGYLARVEDNLFRPLSAASRSSFEQGSGSELLDSPRGPAKMKALHSSSALAVNVFDYWTTTDATALAAALDIEDAIQRIRFEAQYPTGLGGTPPNLDVVLALASGSHYAIESKFTEWMQPKPASKLPFKEKYFADRTGLWAQYGLTACQQLAAAMQDGAISFRYLDAAQLLKHALGLATQRNGAFTLHYIYFDSAGECADTHRKEVEQFAAAVDETLGFTALSYQQLLLRLRQAAGDRHQEYLAYLEERYF